MTPDAERELRNKTLEIERLEKEIELLNAQKRILESKYDLVTTQRTVENKNYETALSVSQLKMDWLAAAKELESLKTDSDLELRDSLCTDFQNKFRFNAFKEIENDPDSILVLKAIAYECFYKACVKTIEDKNLKIKLAGRDRFDLIVKEKKEQKNVRVREKVEKEKLSDPREKMIRTYMDFGASREDAEKQADLIINKGKELVATAKPNGS